MRGISLRSGASIRPYRSAPLLTCSTFSQWKNCADKSISCVSSKRPDPTRRHFHGRSQNAGLAHDIFSNFIGDDGEGDVAAAEAAAARGEREAYLEEVGQVDWIPPSFRAILEECHPDRVLHALQHPQWRPDFVTRASPSLFHKTLNILSPHHFLKPYTANYFLFERSRPPRSESTQYEERSETTSDGLTMGSFRVYSNLQVRFDDFSARITELLGARQHAGHRFTLETYVYLLDLARVMADWELAESLFYDMKKAQIQPDERCYNYYMEARAWAGAFDYWESRRQVTTERMLAIRNKPERPLSFVAYRVGQEGLRMDMIRTLDEMVAHGYEGSEATFSHIITAMGKEADLEGLKSVLKSVWNIDVDLLQIMDEEELETPTYYQRSSHLRPTSRLLFAIANAYSINQEPLMGLKIVDYISRQYDLRIPNDVWIEILTGTYLRCIPEWYRKGTGDQGHLKGKLPPGAFEELWALMIDQPHNVKPTAVMHGLRTDVFRQNLMGEPTFDSLEATEAVLNGSRLEAYGPIEKFLDACDDIRHSRIVKDPSYILPASWFDLRNELCQRQVQLEAVFHRLLFIASRSLEEYRFQGGTKERTWERELLPDQMRRFERLLPTEMEVKMSNGTAVFKLRRERNKAVGLSWGRIHSTIGLLRLGFDSHDHGRLMQNIYDAVRHKSALRPHCENCGEYGHVGMTCRNEAKPVFTRDVPLPEEIYAKRAHRMRRRLLRSMFQDNPVSPSPELLIEPSEE